MEPAGIGDRVEGVHAVSAALNSGRVNQLIVERRPSKAVDDLLGSVAGVPVREVDDLRQISITAVPQGIVAECRPIETKALKDLVAAGGIPALVVLDHVEDPQNVGAVARSALAAGSSGLVVSGRRAAPLGATVFKAAAGALETLPVALVNSIADAVQRLEELEVWTVGLDGTAEESLFGCPLFDQPVAIVVGSEGGGLSRLVSERVSKLVAIPLASPVESLNASVAAALAMFEVARVRQESGS